MTQLRGQHAYRLALLRAWGEEDEARHLLAQLNRIQRAFDKPDYDMPEPLSVGLPDLVTCPAENRVRSVNERDLKRTIEINEGRANAAAQHRVTRQSASPVSRSRPSGRVPTFAKEKRA